MNRSRLVYLYQQYIANSSTVEELEELQVLLRHPENEKEFIDLLDGSWEDLKHIQLKDISIDRADHIFADVVRPVDFQRKNNWLWIRVAAAILVILSATIVFYRYSDNARVKTQLVKHTQPVLNEIMPGSNKAVLTLGNGHKVVLDDAQSGQIATEEGVIIKKIADGQLSYAASGKDVTIEQNNLSIPKGGQYHVTLPDGTQVYLNSTSSLSYPTQFIGSSRNVTLQGEAYFEVAKNAKMPFIINVNNKQKIEVLGTHFNVKAYTDEQEINTTLLEGSVKISTDDKNVILKPGQMAVDNPSKSLSVQIADLEEIMAWKNGLFIFNNENITTVMKKVARWYDVDVVFKGNMENTNFVGNYSRSKSLANLLKNIELMDKVHFRAEGRRITVIAN